MTFETLTNLVAAELGIDRREAEFYAALATGRLPGDVIVVRTAERPRG